MDGKAILTKMDRRTRMELTTGKPIDIVDCHGSKIMKFPLALFNAVSVKPELIVDDQVTITSDLDIKQACRFLSNMMKVPPMPFICQLGIVEVTYDDIMFHSVAEALGMGSFTQNIFDLYFKRVNNTVPSVANIEAISRVRTPPGDKIYKQMAYNIGVKYYEDKIANRPAFETYLETNPRLYAAIAEVVGRKTKAANKQAQNEMSKVAFYERERRREEKAALAAERKARGLAEQKAQQLRLAKAEYRNQKEKAVRDSMFDKKRLGKKMTAEEACAHEKYFGRHVAH